MVSRYADGSAQVLLVGEASATTSLRSAFERSGFANIAVAPDCGTALVALENHRVHWIVAPLGAGEPVTAMHLLDACRQHDDLHQVLLTLILHDNESYCLGKAFELGLFAWISAGALDRELEDLLGCMKTNNYDTTQTAADYIRRRLKSEKRFDQLAAFERRLSALYPHHSKQLAALAESSFLTQDSEGGKRALLEAQALGHTRSQELDKISTTYLKQSLKEIRPKYQLESCLVIDPDPSVHKTCQDAVAGLGASLVQVFPHGEAAWAWLDENTPDLIIQEWKLPGVSGVAMIQRLWGRVRAPLVVLSSVVGKKDHIIMREMGVSHVVEKPISAEALRVQIDRIMIEEAIPTQVRTIHHQLRRLVACGDMSGARDLMRRRVESPPFSPADVHALEGELLLGEGKWVEARDEAIAAVRLDSHNLGSLNVLGKALMKLGDYASALKVLDKARAFSPQNVARLCDISEVQTELGNNDGAEEALALGSSVDQGSSSVRAAEFKHALRIGDGARAARIDLKGAQVNDVVSFLNNRAVALARTGAAAQSVELYTKAFGALPGEYFEVRLLIGYNLGLAYAKQSKLREALQTLEEVVKAGESRVLAKARSLADRIRKALQEGGGVRLRFSKATPSSESTQAEVSGLVFGAGEEAGGGGSDQALDLAEEGSTLPAPSRTIGCHSIYIDTTPVALEETQALLADPPAFLLKPIEERQDIGSRELPKASPRARDSAPAPQGKPAAKREPPVIEKVSVGRDLLPMLEREWKAVEELRQRAMSPRDDDEPILLPGPVYLYRSDVAGAKSLAQQLDALHCPWVQAASEPREVRRLLRARAPEVLVLWFSPEGDGGIDVLDILEFVQQTSRNREFKVWIWSFSDRVLQEFKARAKTLPFDHLGVVESSRVKLKAMIEKAKATSLRRSDVQASHPLDLLTADRSESEWNRTLDQEAERPDMSGWRAAWMMQRLIQVGAPKATLEHWLNTWGRDPRWEIEADYWLGRAEVARATDPQGAIQAVCAAVKLEPLRLKCLETLAEDLERAGDAQGPRLRELFERVSGQVRQRGEAA